MKVKSVTITGMHKVDKKTYTFNDDITYFIGENGSGKSTILEATQLGLLGYIPGYAKTNESIMKHASGPVMSVEVELEDGIKIVRTWTRSGSSVKSTSDITGYSGDLIDLMGQVDLPVFDFNEFRSMTSNKLKDWFISFLPSSNDGIDFKKELKEAMGSRAIPYDYLVEETDKWIQENHIENSVELVRELNKKFKEDQSFVKGQIANLEGTVKSLIKYDDATDLDESQLNIDIQNLSSLKTQLIQYQASVDVYNRTKQEIEVLKNQLPADNISNDPRVEPLKQQIEQLTMQNEVLKADYADLQSQINDLDRAKSKLESEKLELFQSKTKLEVEKYDLTTKKNHLLDSANNASCPLTKEPCPTAANLSNKAQEEAADLDRKINELQLKLDEFNATLTSYDAETNEITSKVKFKTDEMKECDQSKCLENDRKIMQLQAQLGAIDSDYNRFAAMEVQLSQSEVSNCPTEKSLSEIDEEIKVLQNNLIKVKANQRYAELSDKVTADKFKFENELEVYKSWAKLTDANGLQTTLMNKPFEMLAEEMSTYLSQMFNRPTTAKFNLISKANSFSFGLEQAGQYIEFDYLSSGERCLFTLALILCILNKSQSQIRTILIDDILDHLDSENADYLFNALKSIKDVQFILAGVKECKEESICKLVS